MSAVHSRPLIRNVTDWEPVTDTVAIRRITITDHNVTEAVWEVQCGRCEWTDTIAGCDNTLARTLGETHPCDDRTFSAAIYDWAEERPVRRVVRPVTLTVVEARALVQILRAAKPYGRCYEQVAELEQTLVDRIAGVA